MSLQFSVEEIDAHTAIVTFEGALTFGMNLSLADSKLRGLVESGFSRLIFDMTGVPYCDSAGLGAIIHTYGLTKQKQGTIRLCGLSERVAAMLKMTTTDSFLPIDLDRTTCIAALA